MLPIRPALLLALFLSTPLALPAQESGYRLPPQAIVDVVDAPPTPAVDFSPAADRLLLIERPALPSIEEVAAPWVGLAGMRVVPQQHARRQLSLATRLAVRDVATGAQRAIELPADARIAGQRWSPDGRRLAILLLEDQGLDLWLADVETGQARRLAGPLNGVLGMPFGFLGGSDRLWLWLVPSGLELPTPNPVPMGPAVQETSGSSAPLRTYQDLLTDPESEALFDALATSQLAIVEANTGALRAIGKPCRLSDTQPSPDGLCLLVETIERPFSYLFNYGSFPQRLAVWNRAGEELWRVADVPLGDNIPMEGVPIGPRNARWQPTQPATLVWAEAQDGGDPARPAELRDILYARSAPFDGPPVELVRLEQRSMGVQWLAESGRLLASEYDRDRRWMRTWLLDPKAKDSKPQLIEDRSRNDRYGDPGSLVRTATPAGDEVVYERAGQVLRAGPGHSPAGPRPFLARVALEGGERELLWQSAEGRYENLAAFAGEDAGGARFAISSESQEQPTNYLFVDTTQAAPRTLTTFADPTPQLRGIHQELLTYSRADGVPLSGTLYLPADYQPGTRLPLLIWAYPLEYNDASTAGQNTNATTRVLRMRGASHLALLLAGYAVLDNATMPIVGDPETMNETFLEQVVAAAQAAIDACVERGVADPDHVAVAGHSYGAFMTANLLAHSDLFRAGIARSGAYNRSLTPFGFQSERRTIWQAPETYLRLSPFFAADRIDEPLLMIHGEKDSNPGTFPIQSERLYAAIKGNGGTARLVLLPGEDHGYQARESVLHTLAEMVDWCDRFVRPERGADRPLEASSPR